MIKKIIKALFCIILVLILVVLGYAAYILIDYYRLDDNMELTPVAAEEPKSSAMVPLGKELSVTSWNIGFGAYTDDFSFFMDGGEYSRGFSEDEVQKTIDTITKDLHSFNSDFYLVQEVDVDATRSYHINQYDLITESFKDMAKVYAQNYDSPYLFYPFDSPHGKSKAGLVTLSEYNIASALRRSLPIQKDLAKFLDLDRCYSISRIPTTTGRDLVLINFHLSAYTTDPTIADQQLEMLYEDMVAEYKKGNYVVAGGDFNKDLLEDSSKIFGVFGADYSWAKAFPYADVPQGLEVIAPYDKEAPTPSCRNADRPWDADTNFQLTVDGFIASNNVKVVKSDVVDMQFASSDHNPVYMKFILQ